MNSELAQFEKGAMNYEASGKDARRQTERLLADQQMNSTEREGTGVDNQATFAANALESKTKLFRQVALLALMAFLLSVVIFFVFVFPVQMSEESYHGDFTNVWDQFTTAIEDAPEKIGDMVDFVKKEYFAN